MDGLTEHQQRIAERILGEEGARRRHLVVSLSGAHAYGFPSPDSDLDLKAVHAEPTARLLGLSPPAAHASRLEIVEGVEIDYSSNELQPVLGGLIAGNGNYFERFLGAIAFETSPELEELRPLARGALSRRVHRHYAGFARQQLAEWEKGGFRSAKKLLYVLRTALTGAHLLRSGMVETDLGRLIDEYGFGEARELIEAKRQGERTELEPEVAERWRGAVGRAFERLEEARAASSLPEEAGNREAIEAWLIGFRLRGV